MLDAIGYYLLRFLAAFLRALPLGAALACGTWIGRIVYYCRTGKSIGYLNLKAAFKGEKSLGELKRIARTSLENLGRMAVEVLRFPLVDEQYFQRHVEISDLTEMRRAIAKGKGMIFLSSHFGNWEFLHICCHYIGVPVKVLVREQNIKKISEFFNHLRTGHGSELIGRKSSIKEFIRALEKGSVVAIAADQAVKQGIPVEFFGRKTLAPAGFIEVAKRTGSAIFPVFGVRKNGDFHYIQVLPELSLHREPAPRLPLVQAGGEAKIGEDLQNYYRILEDFISRYPDQWLWEHKRWKYCYTKNILILSDGKAGHESQSRAVAGIFNDLKEKNPEYEFKTKTVRVEYRGRWARYLLTAVLPLLLPFIRSRVEILKYFLTKSCYETLAPLSADFVISTGSSVLPLTLLIARENKARKIVLMKPAFPFNLADFDLIVAPHHDAPVRGKNVVYTDITPNLASDAAVQKESEKLAARLRVNGRRVVSVFVGGDTSRYSMQRGHFEQAMDKILAAGRESNARILVTTSRRTRGDIEALVKEKFSDELMCPLVVIANEANIENVTYGMIGLSDTVFVTEDSVSMISEAAGSGKNVVILKVGAGELSPKFMRFQQNLADKHLVKILRPQDISAECLAAAGKQSGSGAAEESRKLIREKLMEMM